MSRARYYCQILNRFSENKKMSSVIKISAMGAELFCVDGQTDRHDEANSRFLLFCKRA